MKKERKNTLEQMFEMMLANENTELTQKENMKMFYIQLTSESVEKAEEVVSGLLQGVANFTEELERFRSDKASAKTNFMEGLRKELEEKTMEEQYEFLRDTLYTLHAVSIDTIKNLSEEVKSREERIESIRSGMPIAEGADLTQEIIDDMIEQVAHAIEECGTLSLIELFAAKSEEEDQEVTEYIKMFQNSDKMNEFVSNEWDNMKIKNYAALVTYIMYQQGELPELPQGMNAEGVGVIAAAEIESGRAVKDAKDGRTTWDAAMDILKSISLIAATCLVIYGAVTILVSYVTLALLAPTLTGGLFFLGLGYLTYRGMKAVAGSVAEALQSASEIVVIPAEILRGTVKVLHSWANSLVNWVKAKFNGLRNQQGETSTNQVAVTVEA